jgi:hypothetical protein
MRQKKRRRGRLPAQQRKGDEDVGQVEISLVKKVEKQHGRRRRGVAVLETKDDEPKQ